MSVKLSLITTALLTIPLLAGVVAPAGATEDRRATTIEAKGPEVFPHSVDYDPTSGTFVVGSLKQGTVSRVDRDGSVRTIVDDKRLVGTQGIRLDRERNRVLVTNIDLGVSVRSTPAGRLKVAGVGSYDARTGRPEWYVDLAAVAGDGKEHLIADLVVDSDGTAYAVDSLSSTVFRVDRRGRASVFLRSDLLRGTIDIPDFLTGLGVSAVALAPGGLLVIAKADGTLVRVPIRHPEQASAVRLSTTLVPLAAALTVLRDGSIAAVSSGLLTGKPAVVQHVTSRDCWNSAEVNVTDSVPSAISSGITTGPRGTAYVLSGGLEQLLAGQPNSGFVLRPVRVG